MCMCVYALHIAEARRWGLIPWTWHRGGCELSEMDPLEEQQALFTAELSLQPQTSVL